MTPALWASLIGAVVLLLTNTAALVKVFADNAKIKMDRAETKSNREKDSRELHDKVLKLEFGYTTLKDSQQLINEQVADTAKAVDFIRNKRAYKTYVTSYDYPDCVHVRNPGANKSVLSYWPYEDRKKVLFTNGRVYNLKITTSGILPQDSTIETITARLYTTDTNGNRKYLCPSYTFKAGNSVQFDLHWEASGVLSVSEAPLDECAPHIEFDCILKANTDVTIYCNGIEWFLNENVAV